MTAIDTNIIVRFLTQDDVRQFARAHSLLASTHCFISDTVLLETGWVLESIYGYSRSEIVRALTALLGLETVHVGDAESIECALTWFSDGMDFADAFHLSSCGHLERFKTFDRAFIKQAAGRSSCVVEQP